LTQALVVEGQEAAAEPRVVMPGKRVEIARHVVDAPDAVVPVRSKADAAPVGVLVDAPGRAVLDFGGRYAELQPGVVTELEIARQLRLIDLPARIAIHELAPCHARLRRIHAADAGCQGEAEDRQFTVK